MNNAHVIGVLIAAAPARTIAALRQVIPIWLSNGYRFETVMHHET